MEDHACPRSEHPVADRRRTQGARNDRERPVPRAGHTVPPARHQDPVPGTVRRHGGHRSREIAPGPRQPTCRRLTQSVRPPRNPGHLRAAAYLPPSSPAACRAESRYSARVSITPARCRIRRRRKGHRNVRGGRPGPGIDPTARMGGCAQEWDRLPGRRAAAHRTDPPADQAADIHLAFTPARDHVGRERPTVRIPVDIPLAFLLALDLPRGPTYPDRRMLSRNSSDKSRLRLEKVTGTGNQRREPRRSHQVAGHRVARHVQHTFEIMGGA